MKKFLRLIFLTLLPVTATNAATISIDAKSVIFAAAGNGNPDPAGLVPVAIPLPAGAGRSLSLAGVTGFTSPFGPGYSFAADGGNFLNVTQVVFGYRGIAGIADNGTENVMALLGVFTAGVPNPGSRPVMRNITNEKNLLVVSTLLNQPFFIGDGFSTLGPQKFLIPDGATGLSFGFADAIPQLNIYQGPPGAYNDNTGSLTVNFTIIPEPGARCQILLAAGVITTMCRRTVSRRKPGRQRR